MELKKAIKIALLLLVTTSFAAISEPIFDQVIPYGGSVVWDRPSNKLILSYNGQKINQFEIANLSGQSCFGTGKITGVIDYAVQYPGVSWVQNLRTENGIRYTEVCRSSCYLGNVLEECATVRDDNITKIPGYSGLIVPKINKFSYLDPGYIGKGAFKARNSDGYIYAGYTKDCPYVGNPSPCKTGEIKPGYTKDNNCILMYNSITENCPYFDDFCECNDLLCDQNYMPKSRQDLFMIQISNLRDSDRDKVTENVNLVGEPQYMDEKVQSCYNCRAPFRKIMNDCINSKDNGSVKSLINSISKSSDLFKAITSIYGNGVYMCINHQLSSANQKQYDLRMGCIKQSLTNHKTSFPKILKLGSTSSSNPSPFVRQFNNGPEQKKARCTTSQENGEKYRGDFFKPKIIVRFGENEKLISFESLLSGDKFSHDDTYGPLSTRLASDSSVYFSPWNNETPITINYGLYDQICKNLSEDKSLSSYICTRIEYYPDEQTGYYVAYHSVKNNSIPQTTCLQLEKSGLLVQIGKVIRPPIKYYYTDNLMVHPISIKKDGFGKSINSAIISIDPKKTQPNGSANNIDLSVQEIKLTPSRYEPSSQSFIEEKECGMLFAHAFCIKKNKCAMLSDLATQAKTLSNPLCNSKNCLFYRRLQEECALHQTNCNPAIPGIDKDIRRCNANPYLSMVNSTGKQIDDLKKNNQWTDEICIETGISYPDSSLSNFNYSRITDRFGKFGNPSYDNVIAYKKNNAMDGRAIRFTKHYDNWISSYQKYPISVPDWIIKNPDPISIANYIRNTSDKSGDKLYSLYFRPGCRTKCISDQIEIRMRNAKEMGMCIGNMESSYVDIMKEEGLYHKYIPLKCQFMEVELHGAGSGGYVSQTTADSGSSGGYLKGMLNNFANHDEFLSIYVGGDYEISNKWASQKGLLGYELKNSELATYNGVSYSKGATSIGRIDGSIYASATNGFDIGAISIIKDRLPGEAKIINTSVFSGINGLDYYGDGSYVQTLKDGSSGKYLGILHVGSGNGIDSGGKNGLDEGMQSAQCDYDNNGKLSTIPNIVNGSGGCAGVSNSGNLSVSPGGIGFASIGPAKIKILSDGSQLISSGSKEFGDTRDKFCESKCPRINRQLIIGGSKVVCEYGGSYYEDGILLSGIPNNLETRSENTAIPSKCVSENGDTIYLPNANFALSKCSGNMIKTDGRYYDICANGFDDILTKDFVYFQSSAGFCDGMYCNLASSITGPFIKYQPAMLDAKAYGLTCMQNGMWSTDTGNDPLPAKNFSDYTNLPIKCPAINSDIINYSDEWTMNANWAESSPGTVVTASSCKNKFNAKNGIMPTRLCGQNGIWGYVHGECIP